MAEKKTDDGKLDELELTFATWDDLAEPPPPIEVEVLPGKKIKYRSFVPADKMAQIQRASRGPDGRVDSQKLMARVLREVMIAPPVRNERDAQKAMKANARIVLGIIGEVMDTGMFDQIKEDLGEDW